MTSPDKFIVQCDLSDPNRGWIDPAKVGRLNPNDTEERPVVTREDFEATKQELRELRRRLAPNGERLVTVLQSEKNRGRINRERFNNSNPNDTEERPVVTRKDYEATLNELRDLRRRMTPKAS